MTCWINRHLWAILWLLIGVSALVYFRKFTEIERGLLAIGLVGIWRYSIQLVHLVRNILYTRKVYPSLQSPDCLSQPSHDRIRNIVLIVADYKIHATFRKIVWEQLIHSSKQLAGNYTVHIVYTCDVMADRFGISEEERIARNMNVHHLTQYHGKRNALADALIYVRESLELDADATLVALMDGDTELHPETLQNVTAVFRSNPHLGAVTTNEKVALRSDNAWLQSWYRLKFRKRDHYMKSHALSRRVLTLTGRFSVFHGDIALKDEFIDRLRSDEITNWLHGRFRFLMGDDKSTCYSVLQSGREMLYLHDTHVTTHERIDTPFIGATVSRMLRWYGNMLRNAPRTIAMGRRAMPGFIWYCYFDQMISYWTTMIGPIVGLVLLFKFGPVPFLGYLGFVMVTRTLQLLILTSQGHRLTRFDLFLTLYDQWMGSLLKIYSTFHPHVQSFALRRHEDYKRTSRLRDELSYGLIPLTLSAEVAIIVLILGV